MEGAARQLRELFSARVILVNHEKRLDVDTVCANLAIKYNMLYISVYQLINQHINDKTELGKYLLKNKRAKPLNENVRVTDGVEDDTELEYSAAHFELKAVLRLIQQTLVEKRTDQQYILLEGMNNNNKLERESDRLAVRNMDELF
jgi:hypothetical protein